MFLTVGSFGTGYVVTYLTGHSREVVKMHL